MATLALLGDVVQYEFGRALQSILKAECNVVKPAPEVRIVEEDLPPKFSELLRRVSMTIPKPEITDDHRRVAIVSADPQSRPDLVFD